jgi:hypothetical protein
MIPSVLQPTNAGKRFQTDGALESLTVLMGLLGGHVES